MGKNIFYLNIPTLGMKINRVTESPRVEYAGFNFCGTWLTERGETRLIDTRWQNSKTGELITNEEFINRYFIC